MSVYAALKAGLVGSTQALAAKYSPQGIRVNAVLLGGIATSMGEMMTNSPEAKAYVESLHGLTRVERPEEIARSVLYLAFDAASFVTGTTHLVDGGFSIYRA